MYEAEIIARVSAWKDLVFHNRSDIIARLAQGNRFEVVNPGRLFRLRDEIWMSYLNLCGAMERLEDAECID